MWLSFSPPFLEYSFLCDLCQPFLGHLLHEDRVVALGSHGRVRQAQEGAETVAGKETLKKRGDESKSD
jgi:hypothetical protein